jgi:dynein intermediate chain 3, axonemal
VSADQPWKQLRKELFQDFLLATPEFVELKEHIRRMEEEQLVLVGYAPELSANDEDMFIVFNNERVAKEASEMIQKMEAFERQRAKNTVFKAARTWKSMGSEQEVDRFLLRQEFDTVDLELQSVYPVKHSKNAEFSFRKVEDARDGYVELVPGRLKFDNVLRKRIDASVQSAPPRVATEQQTDPTFPTNAWSQYLYEINEGITAATSTEKATSEEPDLFVEEPVALLPDQTDEDRVEVTASSQVEELLKTLEFNQIDMYRNDYPFISTETISKPKDNDFEELFCFIDYEKCSKRYVASIDWHPQYSGVFVAAYTFQTVSTVRRDNAPLVDEVNRAVYEENPVLIWSFEDLLNAKLELTAPREVTTVKFCPYDSNLVVGGAINGQVIIWDITDRLKKVEHPELVTPERAQ